MLICFGTLAFSKGLGPQMYSIIPEISYYSESAYEHNQFHNLLGCHFVIEFQRLHTGPPQEFNNNKNIQEHRSQNDTCRFGCGVRAVSVPSIFLLPLILNY